MFKLFNPRPSKCKINLKNLRPGDQLTWEASAEYWFQDMFINLVSNKTHIATLIDDPKKVPNPRILDASEKGVTLRQIPNCDKIEVYRPRGCNAYHIKNGLISGLQLLNEPYGYFTAIRAGVLRLVGLRSLYSKHRPPTCSMLSAIVLRGMGLKIYEGIHVEDLLPDDIIKCDELSKVDL